MLTALVTGASTGIGLATALQLARHRFLVFAKWRVDVLVNNTGIGGGGRPVESGSIEIGKRVFDTNCWVAMRMVPAMREARRGTIVNITSMLGRLSRSAPARSTPRLNTLWRPPARRWKRTPPTIFRAAG